MFIDILQCKNPFCKSKTARLRLRYSVMFSLVDDAWSHMIQWIGLDWIEKELTQLKMIKET